MGMKVKTMLTNKLIPYARNPRSNDAAVDAVAASIKEFGFRQPIVVDEDMVVLVGHTRLKAAQKLGLLEVPVHIAAGMTPAQRRAYRIADNRTNEIAEWNNTMLALELEDLRMDDFDLGTLAFGEGEIEALIAEANATAKGETDADDIPEVEEQAVTQPGDVWLLGKHRIVCGDSTDAATVAKCLNGVQPHLMVTDPPYGVEYDPTRTSKNAAKAGKVLNDDVADWGGGLGAISWRRGVHLARVSAYIDGSQFAGTVGL